MTGSWLLFSAFLLSSSQISKDRGCSTISTGGETGVGAFQ